jgi:chromosome segregation ATPase
MSEDLWAGLYTIIGAVGSGLVLGIANIVANRRKVKAETTQIEAETHHIEDEAFRTRTSTKDQAEATALIAQAASTMIDQLQESVHLAQAQFTQVSDLLEVTKKDLTETRRELSLLRTEVRQLREYVRHLGGDPDNLPEHFGHPPSPPGY